jgi:hypothetical protein
MYTLYVSFPHSQVPKVKHAGSTVSDLPKSEAHIHVGRLPWDHFFLYNAIGELYRRCPTE